MNNTGNEANDNALPFIRATGLPAIVTFYGVDGSASLRIPRWRENFREMFRRLRNLEKGLLALYIIVVLTIIGKGLAWCLGLIHVIS